ncbi:hypothetical protein [Paramicrobacterium fandaimingii]|uniref:hypothetical protein n=1 Tax=Paramicrobacterium fandaimingii TaxID=2708079 RepID=UPI001420E023|nr:hypothetical protein [Microbacterium fandaimingii]
MTTARRTVVFNVTVAFVAAHLVVVLLHELAHVVAGLVLGYHNVLFPFGVTHHPEPTGAHAVIAGLAGPAFSLVTGFAALALTPFRGGFARLIWLWFAFLSVMEGIGYLVLTPFGIGDTGAAAVALELPPAVSWVCFAAGVLGVVWLARHFASVALRHTDGELESLRCFTFYPWIFGTIIALALTSANLLLANETFATGDVFGVLMAAFALGVFSPMAMPFTTAARRRAPEIVGSVPLSLPRVPLTGIAITVVIIALNLSVLSRGLPLG